MQETRTIYLHEGFFAFDPHFLYNIKYIIKHLSGVNRSILLKKVNKPYNLNNWHFIGTN